MTEPNHEPENVPRRSFGVRALTAVIAGVVGIVPVAACVGFLMDPLRRKTGDSTGDNASESGFLPLSIGPDALPTDGTPQSATVYADHVDAWNYYPQQPVGSIWLRRTKEGEVIAFNTICPHLGCSIDYRSAKHDFFCPCHLSMFDLNGDRQNRIPPRNMDRLEVKVVDGKIWVDYQNYRGGIPEKTPV